jgi:hypothetical protein
MATRLQDWMHWNPGVSVGGEGRWLVKWHGNRATRYESYFTASEAARGECTRCDGSKGHEIVELAENRPAPRPVSRSFRRMVESA